MKTLKEATQDSNVPTREMAVEEAMAILLDENPIDIPGITDNVEESTMFTEELLSVLESEEERGSVDNARLHAVAEDNNWEAEYNDQDIEDSELEDRELIIDNKIDTNRLQSVHIVDISHLLYEIHQKFDNHFRRH
jgi:hypothetical protein